MPMNYSTARELAVLLNDEPLAQVTELKRIRDDIYRIRFSDRRDGRTHTILEPGQVVACSSRPVSRLPLLKWSVNTFDTSCSTTGQRAP